MANALLRGIFDRIDPLISRVQANQGQGIEDEAV